MDNVTGGSGDTVTIDGQPRHVSGYLRDFLFPPERLRAPVSMLSGGERNRLLLARLFARPSNLLVMDEPTNDLDAETLDLLEEMVANYRGNACCWSATTARFSTMSSPARWCSRAAGRSTNTWAATAIGCASADRTGRWRASARRPRRRRRRAAAARRHSAASAKPRRLSYNEQRELAAMPR